MIIKTYPLYASNGRYIRKATMVILDDGWTIKFLDKVSKKFAIRQVKLLIKKLREGRDEECSK